MKTLLIFLTILFTGMHMQGQQLVYEPVNPAFGGDSFNYQWLLNAANAQNTFEDPSLVEEEKSDLDIFTEALNQQLLSQVSRRLLDDQLGEDILEPGTSTFGSLELEVFESSDGLVINILDTTTGDQTQIIVPN
ncbi:MAG: curli assembly protein CsgF [Flavobacteriaceae bacterium]|nr:curli assembly protein CsgF [Flavobacteriaceae bacterium]